MIMFHIMAKDTIYEFHSKRDTQDEAIKDIREAIIEYLATPEGRRDIERTGRVTLESAFEIVPDKFFYRHGITAKTTLELKPAEFDLNEDFADIIEKQNRADYELFKLKWMGMNGYTVEDLADALLNYRAEKAAETEDNPDDMDYLDNKLFDEWVEERGFGGNIWPCYEEFLQEDLPLIQNDSFKDCRYVMQQKLAVKAGRK